MRTLYLCYFGLREPLVQTQVLPYLRQLSRSGIEVGLLTFEPNRRASWSRSEAGDWCDRLQADGIRWFSLPYHKRPSLPATTYDIAAGGWMAARLVRRHGYDVVHARAHVAAAMGAIAKRLTGCRLIFDIRGFNPEEYVDAGVWPENGLNYRLAKRVERRLLAAADGFVVLTEKARDILFPGCSDSDSKGRPVEVIPCCVDLARFEAAAALPREQIRRELGVAGRRVMVYVGALGGFYLTDEMAEFLAAAHRQDASTFSMILTQSQPELIVESLKRLGVPKDAYLVRRVPHHEVPDTSGRRTSAFPSSSHPIPSWRLPRPRSPNTWRADCPSSAMPGSVIWTSSSKAIAWGLSCGISTEMPTSVPWPKRMNCAAISRSQPAAWIRLAADSISRQSVASGIAAFTRGSGIARAGPRRGR